MQARQYCYFCMALHERLSEWRIAANGNLATFFQFVNSHAAIILEL